MIVADHQAGAAGNTDLPVARYHIPAMFYAPALIEPGVCERLVSQIDLVPTLLGLIRKDRLALLEPRRAPVEYRIAYWNDSVYEPIEDAALRDDTITAYQGAAALYNAGELRRGRETRKDAIFSEVPHSPVAVVWRTLVARRNKQKAFSHGTFF